MKEFKFFRVNNDYNRYISPGVWTTDFTDTREQVILSGQEYLKFLQMNLSDKFGIMIQSKDEII